MSASVDPYMTPRRRVLTSVAGAGSGMVGVPLVMSLWAPLWATLSWLGLYMLITCVAWYFTLFSKRYIEQWWSMGVGAVFALLPISAVYWDRGTKSFWIAAVIVVMVIANEVSTLPYIKVSEWRAGVLLSGLGLGVSSLFEVGLVGLVFFPALATIVSSADRMRKTKNDLETARSEADLKTADAENLAKKDELTGLLNRRGIAAEIERLASGPHTILMVDANRFKAINDGHGYATGDQVIQQIAIVLQRRLGEGWIVGRQGGDEFVAVRQGVHHVPSSVCASASCHIQLYGTKSRLNVGLSGGFVRDEGAAGPDRSVSKASYAMRAAKRLNEKIIEFDGELAEEFDRMLEVTASSGSRIGSSSLTAEFQIIVDDTHRVVGCEALARWRRPNGTLAPPSGFLSVLAENGQIALLNEAMLTEGIAFASRFNHLGDPPFVAVNIGSPSLASTDLASLISSLLKQFDVAPHRLLIEITESERFDSSWETATTALTTLGVQLAIDDFGAGYSNIERLSQLPISYLKFDRSITSAADGPLGPIAKGVVEFAGQAHIGVIGEGVETNAELDAMRSLGVHMFQGFYFGRPSSADLVERQIYDSRVNAAAPKTLP